MNRLMIKTPCKFCILPLAVLVFIIYGCTTTRPPSEDPTVYKNRTKSSVKGDVAVTVAVPTIAEAQAIYGVKMAKKHFQPAWGEVRSDSTAPYWYLPSGLDPNYFSPSDYWR